MNQESRTGSAGRSGLESLLAAVRGWMKLGQRGVDWLAGHLSDSLHVAPGSFHVVSLCGLVWAFSKVEDGRTPKVRFPGNKVKAAGPFMNLVLEVTSTAFNWFQLDPRGWDKVLVSQ